MDEIERLEPDAFQQRVQNEISSYFNNLYKSIREVEKEVAEQITASTNLAKLK